MAALSKPAVLCVGRFYCDLIFSGVPRLPTLGTEVFTDGLSVHAGGGAFITAAHLASLGHVAHLAAMLPGPPFSALVQNDLRNADIDLTLCKSLPRDQGAQMTVAMAKDGDRAFITRRAGMAFPDVTAADLRRLGIAHIHVGELASLIERPQILDLAQALQLTVSVDCGWDDAFEVTALRALAGRTDVFLPNAAEWAALQDLQVADGFAPLTVIKRGAAGARAIGPMSAIEAPTRAIDAIDTTGAGDAFNAGFLSAWLRQQDIEICLAAGNAQGRLSVQSRGGFSSEPGAASQLEWAVK